MTTLWRMMRALTLATLVVLVACGGGRHNAGPRALEGSGSQPVLESFVVTGNASYVPILQVEPIDSQSDGGSFHTAWEIKEAKAYDAALYVSDEPNPPFFTEGEVKFASLYCAEGNVDCGLSKELACTFDTHNVLACEGRKGVDLTQWLGTLPRKAWIIFEACNGPMNRRACALSAVEVEFR